jgi:putative hemolysin
LFAGDASHGGRFYLPLGINPASAPPSAGGSPLVMDLTGWLVLLGVLMFAGASAFFALAESALFSLGKWRARQVAERPGGALVIRLLEHPDELLATLVLGNTMATGAVVTLALWPALNGLVSFGLVLPLVAAFIILGCEVLPKTLAVRAPEAWSLRVARPVFLLRESTGWLQRVFQRFNQWSLNRLIRLRGRPQLPGDAEYLELVELAFQQGALAQAEKEIILQIISLDRKTAKDVMKPRAVLAAISDECSIEEMIAAARRFRHRRLPIYDENLDTIVGVLNTRQLLADPQVDLSEVIEFPSFVPESMNLLQLLKSLERQQRGMAIVVDEYGGTAGLVTVDDIMAAVVGPIRTNRVTSGFVMEKLEEGRWRVSGTVRLDDFRREYPDLGEVPNVDTMGGLLVAQAEVVPSAGETVTFRGLRLTAKVVDERRVKELLVEVVRRR